MVGRSEEPGNRVAVGKDLAANHRQSGQRNTISQYLSGDLFRQ